MCHCCFQNALAICTHLNQCNHCDKPPRQTTLLARCHAYPLKAITTDQARPCSDVYQLAHTTPAKVFLILCGRKLGGSACIRFGSWREKCEKREIKKHYYYYYYYTAHVECKNKGDTGNNWSDWNHFQIIQKVRERHIVKP